MDIIITGIDIVIVSLTVFSSIVGYMRTIAGELYKRVGLILSGVCAFFTLSSLRPYVEEWFALFLDKFVPEWQERYVPEGDLFNFTVTWVSPLLTWFSLFIIFGLGLKLLVSGSRKGLESLDLGQINNLAGGIYGFARGVVISYVLIKSVVWTSKLIESNKEGEWGEAAVEALNWLAVESSLIASWILGLEGYI